MVFLARNGEHHFGMRALPRFAALGERNQPVLLFLGCHTLVTAQCQNIFVEDLALAVSQLLERGESGVDLALRLHLYAELLKALLEGVAT
ncbi:hypothetical protein D9M68_967460 [compost metagenome]